MGCGGGCPKKKLTLKSQPQGIARDLVEEARNYAGHIVAVRDRTGQLTRGRCAGIWLDDEETGDFVETGTIAIETPLGTNMIGFNIVETIELIETEKSTSAPH